MSENTKTTAQEVFDHLLVVVDHFRDGDDDEWEDDEERAAKETAYWTKLADLVVKHGLELPEQWKWILPENAVTRVVMDVRNKNWLGNAVRKEIVRLNVFFRRSEEEKFREANIAHYLVCAQDMWRYPKEIYGSVDFVWRFGRDGLAPGERVQLKIVVTAPQWHSNARIVERAWATLRLHEHPPCRLTAEQ